MATITGMTAAKIASLVAMQPIASQVLVSPQASVTFSSVPATFKHLRLKVAHPGFGVADYDLAQVNGDVTIGHYFHGRAGEAGVATTPGFGPGKTTPSTIFCGYDLEINNYSSAVLQKIMLASTAFIGAIEEERVSGGWNQTAVVNTIKILSNGGQNYPTGSEFDLYGVI